MHRLHVDVALKAEAHYQHKHQQNNINIYVLKQELFGLNDTFWVQFNSCSRRARCLIKFSWEKDINYYNQDNISDSCKKTDVHWQLLPFCNILHQDLKLWQ